MRPEEITIEEDLRLLGLSILARKVADLRRELEEARRGHAGTTVFINDQLRELATIMGWAPNTIIDARVLLDEVVQCLRTVSSPWRK